MKIKNFAFFGVMASILGVCAANADTPTAKRIASTHYVDETVAPKQDKLDTTAGTGNVTFTGEGNAITGVSASGDGTVQFTKGATFLTATDITGKQDKISNATNGNITTTDASGQTQDSGKTFTTTVDSNSTNAQIPTAAAVQSAITTATADVSGKVDIAQGVGHEEHIVVTDINGNVTTAPSIKYTQVDGLVGAFQAYNDSAVDSGTYEVISAGNYVGKNLIKLDGEKQNKIDSRVPAVGQGEPNYLAITPNSITVGKNLALLDRAIQENRGKLNSKQDASDSNVPVAGQGQQYAVISAGNNVGTNLVALDTAITSNLAKIQENRDKLDSKQNVADSNVPVAGQGQSYNAITSGNSVGTNLVALDTAIGTLSGTAGDAVQGVNATVSGTGEAITAVAENATTHNLDLTKSQLSYAGAMNNALPEINGTANWTTANCTDDDPCVLTMKSNGVFVWTHMVTQ